MYIIQISYFAGWINKWCARVSACIDVTFACEENWLGCWTFQWVNERHSHSIITIAIKYSNKENKKSLLPFRYILALSIRVSFFFFSLLTVSFCLCCGIFSVTLCFCLQWAKIITSDNLLNFIFRLNFIPFYVREVAWHACPRCQTVSSAFKCLAFVV